MLTLQPSLETSTLAAGEELNQLLTGIDGSLLGLFNLKIQDIFQQQYTFNRRLLKLPQPPKASLL